MTTNELRKKFKTKTATVMDCLLYNFQHGHYFAKENPLLIKALPLTELLKELKPYIEFITFFLTIITLLYNFLGHLLN